MKKMKMTTLVLVFCMLVSGCGMNADFVIDKKGVITATSTTIITEADLKEYCDSLNEDLPEGEVPYTVEDLAEDLKNNDDTFEETVIDGKRCWVSKSTEVVEDDDSGYLKPKYCSIPLKELTQSAEELDGFGISINEVTVTFPYKIKAVNGNGVISKNKKTVTWKIADVPKGTKRLKAYTVKYKKKIKL